MFNPTADALPLRARPVRASRLAVALVLLLAALGAAPPVREPDRDLVAAERALTEAKVATDGPALLAFFRARTLTDANRPRLEAALRALGADSFAEREKASAELIRAGRAACPILRPVLAGKGSDLEVLRRVEAALHRIERDCPSDLEATAIRVLAERRPAGAVAALLAYLPWADTEVVEEQALAALLALGSERDDAGSVLLKALADPEPTRRAAAAHVLGRVPARRAAVRRLLADPQATVRFRAAVALAQGGNRAAVPVLVALLAEAPLDLAYRAEELLFRLGGDSAPHVGLGTDRASQQRCRIAWEGWWKANGRKADLARNNGPELSLGLSLVCVREPSLERGQVLALGRDGAVRWKIEGLGGPLDARLLPGGRVLIAEEAGRVTERGWKGDILWRYDAKKCVYSSERLPNGNTFISTGDEFLEVNPAGKKVAAHRPRSRTRHASTLRNGNILYIDSAGIVELGREGKEVLRLELPSFGNWTIVEALPGSRYLVTQFAKKCATEVDRAGKVIRTFPVRSPTCATRLRNGHTFVTSADRNRLIEFDRSGEEMRHWTMPGQPMMVRHY